MQRKPLNPINESLMKRGLQISITFTLTIFIQEWFRYPYAAYTGFVVMMIFIGFDIGAVNLRTKHRFYGTVIGCLAGFVYWYLGHINYQIIFLLIIFWVFNYIYFANYTYLVSTFFTMSLTLIGNGYLDMQGIIPATEIIIDIFLSTIIAYTIILTLQDLFFKDKGLSYKIFYHMQKNLIAHIHACEIEINNKRVGLYWNKLYTQILEEYKNLKLYILMNESLIIKYIPHDELENLMQLTEEYYL